MSCSNGVHQPTLVMEQLPQLAGRCAARLGNQTAAYISWKVQMLLRMEKPGVRVDCHLGTFNSRQFPFPMKSEMQKPGFLDLDGAEHRFL